jgi:hypothetical protein
MEEPPLWFRDRVRSAEESLTYFARFDATTNPNKLRGTIYLQGAGTRPHSKGSPDWASEEAIIVILIVVNSDVNNVLPTDSGKRHPQHVPSHPRGISCDRMTIVSPSSTKRPCLMPSMITCSIRGRWATKVGRGSSKSAPKWVRRGRCCRAVDRLPSQRGRDTPTGVRGPMMPPWLHGPSCDGTEIVRHGTSPEGKHRSRCRQYREGRGQTLLLA